MDIKKFMKFIDASKNQYLAVEEVESILNSYGFNKLLLSTKWDLELTKNYYIVLDGSIFAFKIPNVLNKFNFIGSHTDSPAIMVKPNPIIKENNYIKLNVEVYGGPILNTWFDRPLGFSGKVSYIDEEGNIKYGNVDTKRPIGIIPNLAIHQNRLVNDGVAIDKSKDILPIIGISNEEIDKNYFIDFITSELKINHENVLNYSIAAYIDENSKLLGIENEYISSPRIDNLGAVYTSLDAFLEESSDNAINFFAAFDNEEIGSKTVYGADSNIMLNILNRIKLSLEIEEEDFAIMLAKSTFISADMAHAVHPNFPEKSDNTSKPKMNDGIAIKVSLGKYATTTESSSIVLKICKDAEIPFQYFVNKNIMPSGSTIGPVISAGLSVSTVDIGVPMLAMHSSNELVGVNDLINLNKLFKEFYKI